MFSFSKSIITLHWVVTMKINEYTKTASPDFWQEKPLQKIKWYWILILCQGNQQKQHLLSSWWSQIKEYLFPSFHQMTRVDKSGAKIRKLGGWRWEGRQVLSPNWIELSRFLILVVQLYLYLEFVWSLYLYLMCIAIGGASCIIVRLCCHTSRRDENCMVYVIAYALEP